MTRFDALVNGWVRCAKRQPEAKLRLFCFPYAGGRSLLFRPWSESLPNTIEVCAIELPGRGSRGKEAPYTQIQPLLEALLPELLPFLDKPFAIFGHSMGSVVSFELCRWLRRRYQLNPVHFFASGRRAPQLAAIKPPIHTLPEPELLAELRVLNGTPDIIFQDAEMRQLLLPVIRADFAVIETYDYQDEPPFGFPITTFGGWHDPEATYQELMAWQSHTIDQFALKMFPGDHFFVHSSQEAVLQTLLKQLRLFS